MHVVAKRTTVGYLNDGCSVLRPRHTRALQREDVVGCDVKVSIQAFINLLQIRSKQ